MWEAAQAGQLTPAQALLTEDQQPAEMLFHVGRDPHQFDNLAGSAEHQATLERLRGLRQQWEQETGDSVPLKPTPDRQPIHESRRQSETRRGEFPGQANGATEINRPGPVRLTGSESSR